MLENECITGDEKHRLNSIYSVEEHEKDLVSIGKIIQKKKKSKDKDSTSVERYPNHHGPRSNKLKKTGVSLSRSNSRRPGMTTLTAVKDTQYNNIDLKKDTSKNSKQNCQNAEE